MIESMFAKMLAYWPFLFLLSVILWGTKNYFNRGLNKYPGPVLARFTNLWRFVDVFGRRPDITQLSLHRMHGEIVRLGPNMLSFSSPKAIKTIYGLNKGFIKSDFYPVQQAVSNGKRLPSLFSTTDESYHASLRRCVNSAFSMSALKDYEPLVNETVQVFLDQTEKLYVQTGQVCNFAEWLQFFAFDVIGQITYSKRHGFIDRAEDVDGMVAYLGRLFSYVAPIGQMPWLDLLMLKNPLVLFLDKLGFKPLAFPVATFAKARMQEKLASDVDTEKASQVARADLLTMFMKAQEANPAVMTSDRVLTMAVSMAFAGSETTAISLAAIFYYILQDRKRCYKKVVSELQTALVDGRIEPQASNLVSWSASQTLPYLDACIKEAFRIHPAAGLPLERVTPPQGITISSQHIPGGTIVGINAWVVHRDVSIYGNHYPVDVYVPERWLEASSDQLKEMNAHMLQFGAGARTCIGKNISLLEIYKLVPAFLLRFDIDLKDENVKWQLWNAWFVKQFGFDVRFRRREKAAEVVSFSVPSQS